MIVTPFVGVWIETQNLFFSGVVFSSHPSWVCGLKQADGAEGEEAEGHTLRGCVD